MKKSRPSRPEPPSPRGREHARFSNWHAKDWPELTRIWRELVPEHENELAHSKSVRRFQKSVITPKQGGYIFERWVIEAFRLSGYETEPGWNVPGLKNSSTREQIDGLVLDGWQAFLVESKFREKGVGFDPIALLHGQVSQRPPGCLGLLFSAFGFTIPARESALLHQPLRALLFNGYNLIEGMGSEESWRRMLKKTWVQAVKYGDPFYAEPSA
jgi:hypothetical protein